MCNFNQQTKETQEFIHHFMLRASQSIGGVNFLLTLIEVMRNDKPNPLINKKCSIETHNTIIEWEKIVFKDKFDLLESILVMQKSVNLQTLNLLDTPNQKQKKKILNMVKTLAPIEFKVTPKDVKNGNGFSFKIFESIENDEVTINPIFVALFFCSKEYTKRAMKYKES